MINSSLFYALFVVGGALITIGISWIKWKNQKIPLYHFYILLPIISLLALYGGRWWYLAFNPSGYENVMSLFNPLVNRSILGSIFFITLTLFIYSHYYGAGKMSFKNSIDIILPSMLIGQALGRWGNFYNQELYGQIVSDLNWLPQYIQDGMLIDGYYRQPLFLYESAATFFVWTIFFFVLDKLKNIKQGVKGSLYFFSYGFIRACLELFRDPQFIMNINGFPTNFFWAIIFSIAGLSCAIFLQFYSKIEKKDNIDIIKINKKKLQTKYMTQ